MTDPIHEQLSAFLDGELSAAESELLLKRVERDAELKVLLERYVLAGEALRATAVQARPSRDFSARVAAAIEGESVPARARRHVSQWLKPVAGGAIAAGVAAVALVSFQVTPQVASTVAPQAALQDGSMVAASTLTAQSTVTPSAMNSTTWANANNSNIVPAPGERRVAPPIQVVNNGRLANFVVAHSEYSSPLGRPVLTGLVAEDLPADQPVEQFIVEQLAVDESTAPPARPPTAGDTAGRSRLSTAPRQ